MPLSHYHGAMVAFDMDEAAKSLPREIKDFPVDLRVLQEKFCSGMYPYVVHGAGSIEHIFGELYAVPERIKRPYYLSLVFEITGAAILTTQILSDREKKRQQDRILQQLGMSVRDIEKSNDRQLLMMFLLPLLPALIVSSCFVYVSAGKMQLSAFHLPVFSNSLWIVGSLCAAFAFFILLYGIYYIAARISYRWYI